MPSGLQLALPASGLQTLCVSSSIGAPTLVLVPTSLEWARLEDLGGLGPTAMIALCGFGPIAAGTRAADLLARLTPARVLLIGIAGAYDIERDPLGSALEFGAVAVTGVGVGGGRAHLAPQAVGLPQWPASEQPPRAAVYDQLELDLRHGPLLLSTCAASASPDEARERRERFPQARAEDMEGFGVALACSLAGVRLSIVRGISNCVGDRASEHWAIAGALSAAREQALRVLARRTGGT